MFWGKSKKKLAAVNVSIQSITTDISKQQEDVTRFNGEARSVREETKVILAQVAQEKSEQEVVLAENKRLNDELARASTEVAALESKLSESR